MAKAWEKYLELIEVQNEDRDNEERMVHEGCVIGFKNSGADQTEYAKGGKCYYGK